MKRTELKSGRKSLERRSTFKAPRAAMRQKNKPKRTEPVLRLSEHLNRPCDICGEVWTLPDPHHVVEQQELKARGLHHLLADVRNILWLCPIFLSSYTGRGEQCHERHTNASRRIPFTALTEQNLEFAREVLGNAAGPYLDRRYPRAPSEPIPESDLGPV